MEKKAKTAFVIAEFNPFHNGHAALLRKARERTGADFVCVVLSGDFVQRGEVAIVEKFTRTRMALLNGADLVLELPLYYSLGSAEYFALGAIALVNKLNVCDTLVFGSECGDVMRLKRLAEALNDETSKFQMNLQLALKTGSDFPTARTKALALCLPEKDRADVALLNEPNNLLAVEYLRRILKTKPDYDVLTMKRTSGVSSTQIRASLTTPHGRIAKSKMPETCAVLLSEYEKHGGYRYATNAGLSEGLLYRLAFDSSDGLSRMADVSDDLAGKIYKALPSCNSFDALCETLHTKDLTAARVKRALLHIFLQMPKDSLAEYVSQETVYARVLGFRKDAQPLLARIKTESKLPLISRLSQALKLLQEDARALRLLQEDIRASLVYEQCFRKPEAYPVLSEFEKPIVTV